MFEDTHSSLGSLGSKYVIVVAMTTATLLKLKKAASKSRGSVTLPVKTYRQLLDAAIPTYYLTGKAATDLDKLVEEGLHDHAEGRTITASSISEALAIRRRQELRKK
ncbi:MAG: hypothetical protein WC887_01640 [Candidatus Paceibacterota bacterium]|jgi:hypothetical protein